MNIIKPFVDLFRIVLQFFFENTQSWGWAIILLTLLIKIVLFPMNVKQFQAMEKMKRIQPKMKEIQDKYKDKPEELQRRTMELYQKEKVNPFGSCLPLLIQLPLLWAIFALLQDPKNGIASVIASSPFFWFTLGAKGDILLAILSGVTTFFQQKLTTPTAGAVDSSQKTMLYIMPLMFAFFTWTVTNGIGLYWVASNIIGIAQQYLINEYFIVKEHIKKDNEPTENPTKK
ncbi:MAG TPA: YidC/Oxa1 family membrane protein insertase [Bacillota bacterium]